MHRPNRYFALKTALSALLLLMPGLLWADDKPTPMPSWTVPVLKLVSATRVQPVTGVVISKTGLVAIPEEFATEQDEIIVLDGGTDIVRYGRPAKIIQRFSGTGITVISVANLVRTPPALSGHEFQNGEVVTLQALPPAEMIAQGAAPLSVSATLTLDPTLRQAVISADTALPNVTGALVDACGNLAGINLANGVQSLETPLYTRQVWKDQLAEVARALQADLKQTACTQDRQTVVEQAEQPTESPPPEPELPEKDAEQDVDDAIADGEEETDAATEAVTEPEPAPPEPAPDESDVEPIEDEPEIAPIDPEPDVEEEQTPAPVEEAVESRLSGWWPIILLLVLAALIIPVVIKRRRAQASLHQDGRGDFETIDDPDQRGDGAQILESQQSISEPHPDISVLVVGHQPDGRTFRKSYLLSHSVPELTIGRGAVDISIDNEAISREHARIGFHHAGLTLSGLGARNGTLINGIECRDGEVFYIDPDDEIKLANVTLKISATDGQQSALDDTSGEGGDE